jgi:hypothetical protein
MPEYILKSLSTVGLVTVGLYYTDREPEIYGTGWFGDQNIDVGIATAGISSINTLAVSREIVGFSSVGILTVRSLYENSFGWTTEPNNPLNTQSTSNISIDLSKNSVAIGTFGSIPQWNFTNVSISTSKVTTVTVIGKGSVSMGSNYTINGGSLSSLNWTTSPTPSFNGSYWNVITFRIVNDEKGVVSVFATKE